MRKSVAVVAAAVALVAGSLAVSGFRAPVGAHGTVDGVAAKAGDRPNVVLITTDDQTLTDLRWMPKTRKLIGVAGVTFRNGFSPHPLCCPARAEILTGEFAQNNGVHSNGGLYGGYSALIDKGNNLGVWLQAAGYDTSLFGKFLNGYDPATYGVPPGWDHWHAFVNHGGGYFKYTMTDGASVERHDNDGSYSTDQIATDTVARIGQAALTSRPFFIWSSYYAPHGQCGEYTCDVPPSPSIDHANDFPDAVNPARSKPSFNERNVSDKPRVISARPEVDPAEEQEMFLQRIRSLASVDDAVQRTIDALAATGQLDNTLILFTSDNGFLLGEHRYEGKLLGYEEALRVPFLMRGPGITPGLRLSQAATTVDIAPTIVRAARARAGRLMDGINLMRFVRNPSQPRTSTMLIQAGGNAAYSKTAWWFRGVRTNRYTYVRWTYGFTEFYDRAVDPYQLQNRTGYARYSAVERELARRLRILKRCAGAAVCQQDFGPLPTVPR
jgi:N-acetylglucosamine-6-sulfatase